MSNIIHSPPIFRGSNVIGQINIIINKIFILIFCWESFAGNACLKSGTHGHQQRLGFLLCDALPGLYCSWPSVVVCLWVFLPLVLSSASENACSIGLRSGDWLSHCRIIHFFYLQNSWVAFAVRFGSLSICIMKRRPINFAAFGWIWAESISLYTSELIRLLLSSVTSSLNTSNPVPLEAMQLMHHTAPPCFTDGVVCFGSWAVPSLLHSFFFPSFWYRLILISAVPKNALQKWSWLFLMFFWQSLTWPCLHTLYLLYWSFLLIVDFDSDTSTSWRVFFYWLDVVKGFFFTMDRILWSSNHCLSSWTSRPFYVAELTSAFFFSQNVPNCWFGHSKCSCYLSDRFVCFEA